MVENSSPNIFLSSTYKDLKSERNAACSVIIKNHAIIRMEDWSAEDKTSKDKIKKELKRASAVVLILGSKYGFIDKEENKSLTEFEYDSAKQLGIPIYAFIKLIGGKWINKEKKGSIEYEKLNKFKFKIDHDRLRTTFESNEDLKTKILTSLNENKDEIWHNKDFSDKFFEEKFKIMKSNLGNRYSPEINVDLDLNYFFDAMAKNNSFKDDFKKEFVSFYCSLEKLKLNNLNKNSYEEAITKLRNEFDHALEDINYDFFNFISLVKNVNFILEGMDREIEDVKIKQELNVLIKKSNQFMDNLLTFKYKLLKNPVLFLTGDAGVGKSHLLADLASKRFDNSEVSILLLGSHFNNNENIGKQLVSMLDLDNITFTDFLEKLNNKARYKKSRIIIMIDALNECDDKHLWKRYLNGFIKEIENYEWLGLILSIRNTYLDLLPKDIIEKYNRYNHRGFEYKTFEALKIFCKEYNVDYPSFPILNPEFSNPLFLKLLFENNKRFGNNEISKNSINFSIIMEEYKNNIENIFHENYDVPEGFNITDIFIKEYIDLKIKFNSKIKYLDFFEIGKKISINLNMSNFHLSDILIKEGLFFKEICDNEEIVSFSYEKLEDYFKARYLLDDVSKEILFDEFKKEGKIFEIINHENIINYFGVFEIFAIIIPEKYGIEIYDIDFSYFNEKDLIEDKLFNWFIKSLYWRKLEDMDERIINYIKIQISSSPKKFYFWLEMMVSLSSYPRFILNAKKLHVYLLKYSMSKRDSFWLPWINEQYNSEKSVFQIINWALYMYDNRVDKEYLELLSITLAWFLSSNNQKLRDESTYALIYLLKNNLKILLNLLETFENVDDVFITERLFAIVYACILESKNITEIKLLVEYTYQFLLNENITQNILMNDYEKNIIEYAKRLDINLNLDEDIPNNSTKSLKIPTDDEFSELKFRYINEEHSGARMIFDSTNIFQGDVGREEFRYKIQYWNHKFDYEELEKVIIKRAFDFYDEELHGTFDKNLVNDKKILRNLYTYRIGEKYQLIAFYELLTFLSQKYEIRYSFNKDKKHILKGPWEIGVRNFDPTLTFKNKVKVRSISSLVNFDLENDLWSESIEGLPNIKDLLNEKKVFNKTDDWLLLFGQINLSNSKISFQCDSDKGFYLDLYCLIIKTSEKEDILSKLKYEDISSILPTIESHHQVFDKEFSWSIAFNDLKLRESFEQINFRNFKDLNYIHVPVYLNEWDFDNYLNQNFSKNKLKPSELLYNGLHLYYGEKDNVLYSQDGKEIVVDLSDDDIFELRLLIDKNEFLTFLNEKNLDILWLVSGAKITYVNGSHDYDKQLYLSGVYYLDNNRVIKGDLIYNHYSHSYVASKNSNKFHHYSCKFTKSITKNNLIEFKSIEDALNEGFIPCFNCMSGYFE
ncbi:DUF4062 domain-containing protein [Methanobrevibacter ruminantium]|uniref:DUF4062 domain-containing protein n=1 Tax=Methanobrevibacter ruminantium TaxID=83816 RepID=UPI003F024292